MDKKTAALLELATETLRSPELLEKFARLNGFAVEVARETLERLMNEPGVSEKIESYIFESDNPELKAFVAGQEKGRQQGHSEGFGKGVATGLLTVLGVVAAGIGVWLKGKSET
jgi:hypothetical protein